MNSPARALDHISVTVSDLERSLAFYCDLLGLRAVERHRLEGDTISKMAGKAGVVLDVVRLAAPETPTILLDLQQYVSPQGSHSDAKLGDVAHSHFCFSVTNLKDTYASLQAQGVEFISEPVSFDLDWGVVHVVFLKDPDGFILELVEAPVQAPADASNGGQAG